MSMVLSIYSQKGFREVTLPEQGQGELEILIQKELFDLEQDIQFTLERQEDGWHITTQNAKMSSKTEEDVQDALVSDGLRLDASTEYGDPITILCFEQKNPFAAYKKYSLKGLKQIRIGREDSSGIKNDILYPNDMVTAEHCTISMEGGQAVLRDSSLNGTFLNFRRVYGSTILQYGDSIRVMRLNIIYLGNMIAIDNCEDLRVSLEPLTPEGISALAPEASGEGGKKILYRRSPRNLDKLYTDPFEIEAPPVPQENKDMPLAMVVGPTLTMAIPMLLGTAVSVTASGSGNSSFMYMGMVTAVASALIGTIWALVNLRYAAKTRKQEENRRFERYSEYLIRIRDEIERAHNSNAQALKDRYRSAEECCGLNENSPLLWNRNMSHEDFLSVRLGMGEVPFQAAINIPKERFSLINDSLSGKPKIIQDNFSKMQDVPVTVDLLRQRLVGIAGGENRKEAIAVAKAMIAQIAAANSYTDVKIALVYDSRNDIDRAAWGFALWLPHVWSGDKKVRYIGTNRSETSETLQTLAKILRTRSEEEHTTVRSLKPRIVLFVTDPTLLDGEAISQYVFSGGADLGLTTVLLAERPESLPNECECIIESDSNFQGIYNARMGRRNGTAVRFDAVSSDSLWKLAKALGRIEVVESEEEGEMPSELTFFEMFGVKRPEELNVAERWNKSNSTASMKALVGFRSGNTPCYLDVHERYHGPHGLVAGTTGSGKSETLQTYILSLAVDFSPEDVGFFIIDYKGGGMANLFDNLPHMIGSISNLSGNQVNRAMVSIQAENHRRQRIFTEYGVNNINSYTTLYKNGDAMEPVPHLFIIIDEFAELRREQEAFMKELISVAQVGRSLGVHLILSTQKPSGTVDGNIWANSKFHLCLRVQDRQDSLEMLHRPEAAYLTQAGRCYLQVGNDELFELFQSGWSGASYDEELGSGSMLIAQMLSATGQVELAGNFAKRQRQNDLKRRWVGQLVDILRMTESETGISSAKDGFNFGSQEEFKKCFYQHVWEIAPDFEANQFNDTRIKEFCAVYNKEKKEVSEEDLVPEIIKNAYRLPEVKSKTQLEVTVDYLRSQAIALGKKEIRKLWLPLLPKFLYLEDLEPFARTAFDGNKWQERPRRFQLNAVIGLADNPANQEQLPISIDFAAGGHHMVIGMVSTGKSTMLQSVVYSLTVCYTPDLLNIYCLDFSAKMLSVFSNLKHVGGYVDDSDLETDKLAKLFTMLSRIMDERKELFRGTSFIDYVNHNGWDVPAILVVVDNYGGFHEKTGELYEAIMMRIAKEGISCGIFLLVSAGGIGLQELPNRVAENFRTGLCLEMKDVFAYGDVLHVARPPVVPENRVKGRGLMYCGEQILEFQTALAARAEEGPERTDLLQKAVEAMNAAYAGPWAKSIPCIPENPMRENFTGLQDYAKALQNPEIMPVGYDFQYADIYSFDLVSNYIFLITGTPNSGKSICMENLMLTARDRGDEVLILEPVKGDNADAEDAQFSRIAKENGFLYGTDGQSILDTMTRLHTEMLQRAKIKKACMERKCTDKEMFTAALENQRIDLFIGNMKRFETLLHDTESPACNAMRMFETLCGRGKGYNIFVYAEVSDRDEGDLMGYSCFESMYNYRSGIRFGGRFGDQKLFPFENVDYQEQDRSLKSGTGVIPCENKEDRLVKVVIPMC